MTGAGLRGEGNLEYPIFAGGCLEICFRGVKIMIGIIDYDAGNIKSVEKALHYLGEQTVVSRDPQVLLKADKVILPGVGSFGDAMNNLNKFGLVPVIREIAEKKTPFLGICLGLQLLFESSDETPGVEGLGLLKGKITKIPSAPGLKIPHMGWNSLHLQNDGRLFIRRHSRRDICVLCPFLLPAGRGAGNCEGYNRIRCDHPCICREG